MNQHSQKKGRLNGPKHLFPQLPIGMNQLAPIFLYGIRKCPENTDIFVLSEVPALPWNTTRSKLVTASAVFHVTRYLSQLKSYHVPLRALNSLRLQNLRQLTYPIQTLSHSQAPDMDMENGQ